MIMPETPKVNVLLFDLGGVLLEIDWMRVFLQWSSNSRLSAAEMADRFSMDVAYQNHECGQISGSEYFSYLREIMQYQGDEASFILGWNSIFVGLVNETINTLANISPEISLCLLTNTNTTHETEWRTIYSAVIDQFSKVFVSSTMGYRKPDRKAFEQVVEEMNVEANEILFFDDTEENVEGAKAAGLLAVHVTQPADIRMALVKYGCSNTTF